MKQEEFNTIIVEEYKAVTTIFRDTVGRYYKLFAFILTISTASIGIVEKFDFHEGYIIISFLIPALSSLESYLRLTSVSNIVYTEFLEKKINKLNDKDILVWYSKYTHGNYLSKVPINVYSITFLFRYLPFIILLFIFETVSIIRSSQYINHTYSSSYFNTYLFVVSISCISVIIFNIGILFFVKYYKNKLDIELGKIEKKGQPKPFLTTIVDYIKNYR
ncbi:hypothetical protein PG291_10265 [Riemerella anatipestifer]|nr:hypothetical protein [Riemerella anatipestifer]